MRVAHDHAAPRLRTTSWLVAAIGIIGASCTLNTLEKDHCVTSADCLGGSTCVNQRCLADAGAGAISGSQDAPMAPADGCGHADAASGYGGNFDDGADGHITGSCPVGLEVGKCPGPTPSDQCQHIYCGGRLWLGGTNPLVGQIPYRIRDPEGLFSNAYKTAIQDSANAWSTATGGLITFTAYSDCPGRFISVVPGWGDGISNPGEPEAAMSCTCPP